MFEVAQSYEMVGNVNNFKAFVCLWLKNWKPCLFSSKNLEFAYVCPENFFGHAYVSTETFFDLTPPPPSTIFDLVKILGNFGPYMTTPPPPPPPPPPMLMVSRRPCAPKTMQLFSQSRYTMWRHNEDNYLHIKNC
jgi:hypothetical protein